MYELNVGRNKAQNKYPLYINLVDITATLFKYIKLFFFDYTTFVMRKADKRIQLYIFD